MFRTALLLLCLLGSAQAASIYAPVVSGEELHFPTDFGSHPAFRTEWWYVTGWIDTAEGKHMGFQVTFFRTKPTLAAANPSAFAPTQIVIAHCALSDPDHGRLWQDQRVRRAGFGLVGAAEEDTDVRIDGWTLKRHADRYIAQVDAAQFAMNMVLTETQPPLLNGERGYSRKGPGEGAASYYYSIPHLKVTGTVSRGSTAIDVTGEAWLDHEWSSEYLDPEAVGWDWVGLNLNDGAALMAFRIRDAHGSARWAGGSYRDKQGRTHIFRPEEITFTSSRTWRSPATGIRYPVEMKLQAGALLFQITPLLDDQENDTRLSTGAIYWEGAIRAGVGSATVGRGYLELTGYGEKLSLR
jgi:predicted secreted hydrolase